MMMSGYRLTHTSNATAESHIRGGGKGSHYPIDSDLWWFGFDCAHAGDGKDLQLAYERFPNEREHIFKMIELEKKFPILDEVVRTEGYVVAECRRLAEQLKEFEK